MRRPYDYYTCISFDVEFEKLTEIRAWCRERKYEVRVTFDQKDSKPVDYEYNLHFRSKKAAQHTILVWK